MPGFFAHRFASPDAFADSLISTGGEQLLWDRDPFAHSQQGSCTEGLELRGSPEMETDGRDLLQELCEQSSV